MNQLLQSTSPFVDEDYEPYTVNDSFLSKCKVLVIGAGGLGCEILKDLVLSKFKDIHVIDMDTIELSNLNRQFLFRLDPFLILGDKISFSRMSDIGQSKAITAANFIKSRLGVAIQAHFCKIQDKDQEFYRQFDLCICGLDSILARRWINSLLCNLVEFDENGNIDPCSVIPLIDGGTEGFKGNSRVIIPMVSACFECNLDLFPPTKSYPICTIANTPRLPEHCIEWASVLEWPLSFPNTKLDPDCSEHVDWIYKTALTRASIFNIPNVTRRVTMGVLKNIIPAIASTNAIIAASCCQEALKIVTKLSPYLNNYFLYNGSDSIYSFSYSNERKSDCSVCCKSLKIVQFDSNLATLEDLYNYLIKDLQFALN